MKLVDHALSMEAYKVRLALSLFGLKADRQVAAIEDALADHEPAASVPALDVEGARLRGIREILTSLAPEGWLPRAAQPWLDFAFEALAPFGALRNGMLLEAAPEGMQAAQRQVANALVQLDDHLIEQSIRGLPWLAGAAPSLADLASFPAVALAGDVQLSLDRTPMLARWASRFAALPGFIPMAGMLTRPPSPEAMDTASS